MGVIAQVTVSLTEDGQVKLAAGGPGAGNKVLLLGLLEMGKGALLQQGQPPAGAPKATLLVAQGSLPDNGR